MCVYLSIKRVRVVVLLDFHRYRYVEQISNLNDIQVIRTYGC